LLAQLLCTATSVCCEHGIVANQVLLIYVPIIDEVGQKMARTKYAKLALCAAAFALPLVFAAVRPGVPPRLPAVSNRFEPLAL